jgi:hypothetical protein
LYRVIEKNSQEKNAHQVEPFGDALIGSQRYTIAIVTVSFAALFIHFFAPASEPHEYWRFLLADFVTMERRATTHFLYE